MKVLKTTQHTHKMLVLYKTRQFLCAAIFSYAWIGATLLASESMTDGGPLIRMSDLPFSVQDLNEPSILYPFVLAHNNPQLHHPMAYSI